MALRVLAHLGQQLQRQHARLGEVGHHADRHREQAAGPIRGQYWGECPVSTNESSPGVVHQPQPALLRLAAELQTQQALVLVSQGRLDTRVYTRPQSSQH